MTDSDAAAVRYVAGGTVQAGEGIYIERSADAELIKLCSEGAFAYVLTSRQMGKSSLMIRTAEKLIQEGSHPGIIDLTEFGANITDDQWYRGFLRKIEEQLQLQTTLDDWWTSHNDFSLAQRFNLFLTEIVIRQISGKIVIFVDEIDTTLRVDFTDDFFASIRHLYNERARDPHLARLSFVLLGSAAPGDLIKDPSRTPFNIGYRVDLSDFSEEEAKSLSIDHNLVRSVLRYTNGHPYFTLRVFRSLAQQALDGNIDNRIDELFFGSKASEDTNLPFVRDMLTVQAPSREAILSLYRNVWRGKEVPDLETDPVCSWLRLSGVVRSSNGLLKIRNAIYERTFDEHWIKKNRRVNWQ